MKMKLNQMLSTYCNLAILVLVCSVAAVSGAQDRDARAAIVSVDGIPAIRVSIAASQGGMILPIPEAIFDTHQGSVVLEVAVTGFPSNAAILDFGGGGSNRILISDSYAGETPFPSQRGHFRLIISDGHGAQPVVEGPIMEAGHSHLLALTWRDGRFDFLIDGKSAGTVQSKFSGGSVPDRLALIEPLGISWEKVEVWSKQLTYDEIQRRSANAHWTLDSEATFLAVRAQGQETPQTSWIGPGLMNADKVMKVLRQPLSKRELFVDIAKGRDDQDGSLERPYKTIVHAAEVAGPGDTVTLMPGTYRESVQLTRSGREDAPITFRASSQGPVIFDGTDPISGFEPGGDFPGGSLWVKTGFHSRDVMFGDPKTISILKGRGPTGQAQLEYRGRVDTLWLDGQFLPKGTSRETLHSHSFWVDKEKNQLILALDPRDRPENHLLEIGARGAFFSGDVSYIHLRGFRAMRADTAYFVGAINPGLTSSNWVIENIVESWGNWAGILLHGWGHLVRRNITDDNGDDGIEGTLCQYVTLDGNISRSNDWQLDRIINPNWGSGGSKFTQVNHMAIRNHEAAFNHGPGIWFDVNNRDITIENSLFHHNRSGIMVEISPGPFFFRNNICFANEEAGIVVAESSNATIENNTLVANKYGIDLRNIPGRKGPGLTEAQGTFKTANVSIRHNIIAQNQAAGIINSFLEIDLGENKVQSDSNIFFKNAAILIWPVKQGSGAATTKLDASNDWTPSDDGGGTRFLSLDAVHTAIGLEANSIVADPRFVMPEISDYRIDPHGPARLVPSGPTNPK
jgi:hypothetical protein